MTTKQKLELRRSEVRSRLAEIAGLDELTDEIRTESKALETEFADLETRYRAALLSEQDNGKLDETDTKGRKLRSLVKRASLVSYLSESVRQNEVRSGSAEAELRSELLGKNAQPGQVPLAVLAPEVVKERKRETRATDTATDVGAIGIPNRQNQIIRRVFSQSATSFLGIRMPSVAIGETSFPYLSAGVSPAMKAKGARADAEAATFSAESVGPTRLSARYLLRVEDLHRLAGMESALRADLRGSLSESLDAQTLVGDGVAPNVTGLLSELPAAAAAGAAEFSWQEAVQVIADQVDGKYAADPSMVRMLCASDLYSKMAIRLVAASSSGSSVSAASRYIQEISGGLRVSANMPAADSNISTVLLSRMGHAGAFAPIWGNSFELIRDPYSHSATGEVALTAIILWAFVVPREDVFALRKLRIAV